MALRCPPELTLRSALRLYNSSLNSSIRVNRTAAVSLSTTSDKDASRTHLAAVCTELNKPLQILRQARVQLADNQVRIKVKHAAINFGDILQVQGKYQIKPDLPFVPGSEISGEITEVGTRVTRVHAGDHVLCIASGSGGFSQELITGEESCFKIAAHARLSLAEGSALICSYATAELALTRRVNIKSSDTVLVTAAAGALGLAAVDLAANVYGAKVIGACGGADKCELVRSYGAKVAIDYTKENLRERLKELTDGKGVDVIVDVVGGKVLEDCLKNIAYEGRVLTLGYASGEIPKIALNLLLVKNYSVHGVFWGSYSYNKPDVFLESINTVIRLWTEGKIKPHVGKIFPLEQINEALKFLGQRQSTGKVILDCEAVTK